MEMATTGAEPASRCVLRDGVTRDDIDDAMHRCGWRITNIFPGSDTQPGQVVYATADRRSLLYLVQDVRLDVVYFTGAGSTIDAALAQVRAELDCHETSEAVLTIRSSDDRSARARALAVVALTTTGEPSAEQLEAVLHALGSEDAPVRNAALVAATYAPWEALRAPIEQLAKDDLDETVRGNASRLLDGFFTG